METGPSRPSRDLLLRLSETLDVPLRERNRLLLAAGFAPTYLDNAYDSPAMAGARSSVREVLAAHSPYPALAVDRTWNVLDMNPAVAVLVDGVAPALFDQQPLNALRLTLHPDGMAPRIRNPGQWRAAVLGSLRRSAQARADPELIDLHDELVAYPGPTEPESPSVGVYVPLRLQVGETELSFLAMIATFGTALDITLSELAIESFFPADPETSAYLRERA